ncbi:hypothetical protein [Noviherbaspirillum agri]
MGNQTENEDYQLVRLERIHKKKGKSGTQDAGADGRQEFCPFDAGVWRRPESQSCHAEHLCWRRLPLTLLVAASTKKLIRPPHLGGVVPTQSNQRLRRPGTRQIGADFSSSLCTIQVSTPNIGLRSYLFRALRFF